MRMEQRSVRCVREKYEVRLLLIRHGQTISNIENRYQGHADTLLSDNGRLQAACLGKHLSRIKIDAIYSSDLSRARETAESIAAYHNLPVITNPGLRECCFGEWEGHTVDEIQEIYPELYNRYRQDSIKNRAPGGERLEELQERVVQTVNDIISRHRYDTVVIATHGGPVKAFVCYALQTELTSFRKMNLDNCGITEFSIDESGKWFLDIFNDTCYMDNFDETSMGKHETSAPDNAV